MVPIHVLSFRKPNETESKLFKIKIHLKHKKVELALIYNLILFLLTTLIKRTQHTKVWLSVLCVRVSCVKLSSMDMPPTG